jgi:hypothetical protein
MNDRDRDGAGEEEADHAIERTRAFDRDAGEGYRGAAPSSARAPRQTWPHRVLVVGWQVVITMPLP